MIYLIRLFRLITGRASLITKSSTRPQTLSIDMLAVSIDSDRAHWFTDALGGRRLIV